MIVCRRTIRLRIDFIGQIGVNLQAKLVNTDNLGRLNYSGTNIILTANGAKLTFMIMIDDVMCLY